MKTMKKLFGIVLMLMVSMVTSADELVKFDTNEFTGGKVEKASEAVISQEGEEPVMVQVTITVTPDARYYITKDDIVVMATYPLPPTPNSETRGEGDEDVKPDFAGQIELIGEDDPQKLTEAREYTFTIEKGFGVWVTEANFKQAATEGEVGDVNWNLKAETKGENPKLILTLDGAGAATLDEGSAPWSMQKSDISSLVIGKDVTALGAGLLSGCDHLTSVEIQNAESVIALGEDAIPANEGLAVDVPGNIFNMYKMNEGWKDFDVDSKNAVKMKGVKFVEDKNQYDVYASLDQTLKIPVGVEGYSITGVQGSKILYKKVDNIKAGDVVLLFGGSIKTDDLRTVADGAGSSETKGGDNEKSRTRAAEGEDDPVIEYALKVVKEDPNKKAEDQGLDVKLGQVYMLYNDVFYLTQAGRIPVGGIYLEEVKKDSGNNSNAKSRSVLYLTFDGAKDADDTTAIISHLSSPASRLSDAWYSLDGRRLSAAPTAKGLYIHAGKMVVIR